MSRKHYSPEDDQVLLGMARKGATNQQIAEVLGRSVRSIESRKCSLRVEGLEIQRAPRGAGNGRRKEAAVQLCIADPAAVERTVERIYAEDSGPLMPLPAQTDPFAMLRAQIEEIKNGEAALLEQLEKIREAKAEIFGKLRELNESLLGFNQKGGDEDGRL